MKLATMPIHDTQSKDAPPYFSRLPEDAHAVRDHDADDTVQTELANAWSALRCAEEAAHDMSEDLHVLLPDNRSLRDSIAQLFRMARLARRHLANAAGAIEDEGLRAEQGAAQSQAVPS